MHGFWRGSKKKGKGKFHNILKRCFSWMGYTLCNVKGRTWEANRQGSGCGLLEGRPPSREVLRKNTNRQTSEKPKIFRQFYTKRNDKPNPSIPRVFTLCAAVLHTPATISYPLHSRTHSDTTIVWHIRSIGHHSHHRHSVTSQKTWILTHTAVIWFNCTQFESWPCQ